MHLRHLKRKKHFALALSVSLLFGYFTWRFWPVGSQEYPGGETAIAIVRLDTTDCGDLLVGVQAEMRPWHYRSEEAFFDRLDAHLLAAKKEIMASGSRIIVFPEHIGTWLVAAGERPSVYTVGSTTGAMATLIASHPLAFLRAWWLSDAPASGQAAVFLMKATQSAAIYEKVFSRLARRYEAYVVAGSIVLPCPSVANGHIRVLGDTLFNASFTFLPDGSVASAVTRKVFPIADEQPFCGAGKLANLAIVPTPAGNLGTLICADSWYPESYERLRLLNTDIIAVPSYSTGKGIMATPWKGYNGYPAPSGTDLADIGQLTEEAAWDKYALTGRLASARATTGINVFLRGQLWDMQSDGHSKMVRNGQDHKTAHDGAALLIGCLFSNGN